MSIQLYDTDFVIITENGEPLEGLDIIYHYSTIVTAINDNKAFTLEDDEELVAMTDLPEELQNRYIAYLSTQNKGVKNV